MLIPKNWRLPFEPCPNPECGSTQTEVRFDSQVKFQPNLGGEITTSENPFWYFRCKVCGFVEKYEPPFAPPNQV